MRWLFPKRSPRRRRSLLAGRNRCFQVEPLESRVALAVTATLNAAGVLEVAMSAAGDIAHISNQGAAITVNQTPFNRVKMLDVRGAGLPNQVVDLDGQVNLGSHVTIAAVSAVNANGTWRIGDFTVSLSQQTGGIHGTGAFTVLGPASFTVSRALGDVVLTGPNHFEGLVSIVNANNVALTNTTRLRLERLRLLGNATLTSSFLQLTGPHGNYESLRRGLVTLQPFSRQEPVTIGAAIGYGLTQGELDELFSAFGSMTIGRADGQNPVEFRTISLAGSVVTIQTSVGGSITVDGAVRGGPRNLLDLSAPVITLNNDVSSSGLILFHGPVVLGKPRAVEVASPGGVQFLSSVNDDVAPTVLRVDASRGDVTFATVGTQTSIDGLRIIEARNVSFNGGVVTRFVQQLDGLGVTTLNGPLVIKTQAPATAVDLENHQLVIRGSITAPGDTVRLSSRADVTDTNRITANLLSLQGRGYRLTAPSNRVAVLTASILGDLELTDSTPLTVGTGVDSRAITTLGHPLILRDSSDITFTGNTIASGSQITLAARNIREARGALIATKNIVITASGSADLSAGRNDLEFLSARTVGNLSVFSSVDLAIVNQAGVNGIATGGGNVDLATHQILTVSAPIDTQPGRGGALRIIGNVQRLRLNVTPNTGAGNVVLTLD